VCVVFLVCNLSPKKSVPDQENKEECKKEGIVGCGLWRKTQEILFLEKCSSGIVKCLFARITGGRRRRGEREREREQVIVLVEMGRTKESHHDVSRRREERGERCCIMQFTSICERCNFKSITFAHTFPHLLCILSVRRRIV
jgi:hypothetical protein